MTKMIAAACVLSVVACSTLTPAQRAAVERDARQLVVCNGKEDCEIKWATALRWVQDNSRWKLRAVTDSLVTTEGPFDTPSAAFEVMKFPRGGGSYEFQFRAACGNIFGCIPEIVVLAADFNNTVANAGARKGWSAADTSVFMDRCRKDSIKVHGASRTPEQLEYGCSCLGRGLEARYSLREFGALIKDEERLKREVAEINAECRKDLPPGNATPAPAAGH